MVWERLDRVVANGDWEVLFLASKVSHLECGCSDHKLIVINPSGIPIKHHKPWHFEQVWLQDEGCHITMEGAWSSVQGYLPLLVSVKTKLGKIQAGMKVWSRNSFGNITKKIANVRKNLKDAESKAIQGSRGQLDLILTLKEELRTLKKKNYGSRGLRQHG